MDPNPEDCIVWALQHKFPEVADAGRGEITLLTPISHSLVLTQLGIE